MSTYGIYTLFNFLNYFDSVHLILLFVLLYLFFYISINLYVVFDTKKTEKLHKYIYLLYTCEFSGMTIRGI